MSHTAKMIQAHDRIKAFAKKFRNEAEHRKQAQRAGDLPAATAEPLIMNCNAQAAGLDIAVRVIEDLLAD